MTVRYLSPKRSGQPAVPRWTNSGRLYVGCMPLLDSMFTIIGLVGGIIILVIAIRMLRGRV